MPVVVLFMPKIRFTPRSWTEEFQRKRIRSKHGLCWITVTAELQHVEEESPERLRDPDLRNTPLRLIATHLTHLHGTHLAEVIQRHKEMSGKVQHPSQDLEGTGFFVHRAFSGEGAAHLKLLRTVGVDGE